MKIRPIREVLLQFMSAIRSFTNQVEENMTMEIAELLMRSGENVKNAVAIQNSIDAAREALMKKLFAAIEGKVAGEKLVNEYDYVFQEYQQVRTFYKKHKGSYACPGISYLYKKGAKADVDIWARISIEWAAGQAIMCGRTIFSTLGAFVQTRAATQNANPIAN